MELNNTSPQRKTSPSQKVTNIRSGSMKKKKGIQLIEANGIKTIVSGERSPQRDS
jgi:hypothetical protein